MAKSERQLTLMRHGKAARGLEGVEEFDRPLTARGVTDAAIMAEVLRERLLPVELCLVSSARRARITGEILAGILGLPSGSILLEERIYMAEPEQLLYRLQELPSEVSHVILLGHNPGVQEAASLLAETELDPFPTSGAALFRIAADRWSGLSAETAILEELLTPKSVSR